MKPVTQTKFGMQHGNCFAACVASILEVRLECIPNLMHLPGGEWFTRFNFWGRRHGFQILSHPWSEGLAAYTAEHHPEAYCIVSGPAERGFDHSCVYSGAKLAHDPHPSRAGLLSEAQMDVLFLSDPEKLFRFQEWAAA